MTQRRQNKTASETREGGTQGCGASRKGQQHPVASPAAVSQFFHRGAQLHLFNCGIITSQINRGKKKEEEIEKLHLFTNYAQLQAEFFSSDSYE